MCQSPKPYSDYKAGDRRCSECRALYMKTWADNNREKIKENGLRYRSTIKGRASSLWNAALKRAKSKDEDFKLTVEDIEIGLTVGICVRTLLPFDFSPVKGSYHIKPLSPSIDKIDPRGIYEPSNVQYVCSWYNLAKGQMTDSDLIALCKRLVSVTI